MLLAVRIIDTGNIIRDIIISVSSLSSHRTYVRNSIELVEPDISRTRPIWTQLSLKINDKCLCQYA